MEELWARRKNVKPESSIDFALHEQGTYQQDSSFASGKEGMLKTGTLTVDKSSQAQSGNLLRSRLDQHNVAENV